MAIPDFSSPEVLMSLLMLTFLEIILGVDNIVFLSIISSRLDPKDEPKARNIGLLLAMAFRIILLFGITWLMALNKPFYHVDFWGLHGSLSGQAVILLLGGIFLIYKATTEIHHKLESTDQEEDELKAAQDGLASAIVQIAVINVVFSIDSILTAVGMTKDIMIMIIAVVISIGIMMAFAGPVSRFVIKHPTIQMLGLSFLILIGFSLIGEAAHMGHFIEGSIPKGYLYFAIFFSLFVEMLNLRLRKKRKPITLHGPIETAMRDGLLTKDRD